jgi:hypothetical protein
MGAEPLRVARWNLAHLLSSRTLWTMQTSISIGWYVFVLGRVKILGFPFEMHMALTAFPCTTVLASDTLLSFFSGFSQVRAQTEHLNRFRSLMTWNACSGVRECLLRVSSTTDGNRGVAAQKRLFLGPAMQIALFKRIVNNAKTVLDRRKVTMEHYQ